MAMCLAGTKDQKNANYNKFIEELIEVGSEDMRIAEETRAIGRAELQKRSAAAAEGAPAPAMVPAPSNPYRFSTYPYYDME